MKATSVNHHLLSVFLLISLRKIITDCTDGLEVWLFWQFVLLYNFPIIFSNKAKAWKVLQVVLFHRFFNIMLHVIQCTWNQTPCYQWHNWQIVRLWKHTGGGQTEPRLPSGLWLALTWEAFCVGNHSLLLHSTVFLQHGLAWHATTWKHTPCKHNTTPLGSKHKRKQTLSMFLHRAKTNAISEVERKNADFANLKLFAIKKIR